MNSPIEKLVLVPEDPHGQITEIANPGEETTVAVAGQRLAINWRQPALHNYESRMRKFAAACEAGR